MGAPAGGGQPAGYAGGDVYHYALMRILIAARARGLQAIDGPYLKVRDVDGFRRSAASAAALGCDGKWVLHPDQIDAANEVFAPSPDDFARASRIVEAYAHATGVQARGAVMFGDEMIDEASHKMARAIAARGRASGLGHDAGIGSEIPKQDRKSPIFAPGAQPEKKDTEDTGRHWLRNGSN
jgi:citrate lyase subunit beta / citryl-CoA lyase